MTTLNEKLADFDYDDLRARIALLEELHAAGRYEEEALLSQARTWVGWDSDYGGYLFTPLALVGYGCPYCIRKGLPGQDADCPHLVDADLCPVASVGSLSPVMQTFTSDSKADLVQVVRWMLTSGSPVVIGPSLEPYREIVIKPDVIIGPPPEPGFTCVVPYEPRVCKVRSATPKPSIRVCAPHPRTYLTRLANFLRQREEAGCPIELYD